MQSTRFIFKGLANTFKASWPSKSYKLVNNKNLLPYITTLQFYGNRPSYQFSAAQQIEKKTAQRTQLPTEQPDVDIISKLKRLDKRELLEEIRILTRTLFSINRATFEKAFANEPTQSICRFLSESLDKFNTPEELGEVGFFISAVSKQSQATDALANYLNKYPSLLTIPSTFLGFIIQNLSNTKTSASDALFQTFVSQLRQKSGTLKPRESMALIALADSIVSARNNDKEIEEFNKFLDGELERIAGNIGSLDATSALSFLKLYIENGDAGKVNAVKDKVLGIVLKEADKLTPSQVADLCSVLTLTGHHDGELFASLEEHILDNISDYHYSQLAEILNSFTGAGAGSNELFMEIDRRIGLNIKKVDPVLFPSLVYDFAGSGRYRQKFFALLVDYIKKNISTYSGNDLAKVFWAYASSGTITEGLFTQLETELLTKVDSIDLSHARMVLESFALLKVTSSQLIDKLVANFSTELADTRSYESINKLGVLSLVRALESLPDQVKQLISGLSKYLIYQLRRVTPDDKYFVIGLGNALGEFLYQVKGAEELTSVYLQAARDFKDAKGVELSEEELSEIQFIIVNLEGLTK